MDLTRFPAVFLLLVFQTAAAHVEPPTNVTLDCHNLQNTLKWSYGQHVPGLRFKISIGAVSRSYEDLWVDPPAEHANVSFLSDPNDDYYVTVTAVIGQNESEAAPYDGLSFSYFSDSLTSQKCFVDFPPVNATAYDGYVLFHFTHPWVLYHHKMQGNPNTKPRKKKSHNAHIKNLLPELKYNVAYRINQRELHTRFTCVRSVCNGNFSVDPAEEKHCMKIRGEMEKMSVQATQEYCALSVEKPAPKPDHTYIIIGIVVTLMAFIALVFVLIMVYRKKTKPSSSPLPSSMTFTSRLKQWTMRVGQVEPVLVPEVGPSSPSPLLQTPEEEEFIPTSSNEPDFRMPIGVWPADEHDECDDVEVGNNEGQGYVHGRHLDEDDEESVSVVYSDYEKRETFDQQVADNRN